MIKTYTELMAIPEYEDRFEYLKMENQHVADSTFGFDRWINQTFYRSAEWKRIRDRIIIRDNGCDLAHPDHPIAGRIYIHHLNPITIKDIVDQTAYLTNPEYLVCVSQLTHEAIHYSDSNLLPKKMVDRTPNDTCPWKSLPPV